MNADFNTTLKVIAFLATGFAANAGMTLLSAPGHTSLAIAAGLLLTSAGLLFAKYAMEIVVLPFAIVAFVFRWALGRKAKQTPQKGGDRVDAFGRSFFVAVYGCISGICGLFVGAMDGGMGWFVSAVMFTVVGVVLAILVPSELLWAVEDGDASAATLSDASKADLEQARRDGVPAVLFADKFAKVVVKAVTGNAGADTKR